MICALSRSSLFVGALEGFVYALPSLIEEEDIITEVSSRCYSDCCIGMFKEVAAFVCVCICTVCLCVCVCIFLCVRVCLCACVCARACVRVCAHVCLISDW